MDNNLVNKNTRRFDIDHLRVFAFGLLIFYHTGMLYTANWGYHIKSSYLSETLESVMLLVSPWRMPLLWIVSGIASYFLLKKLPLMTFLTSRTIRLLLPLLFGILFIVPFQLYFEMKSHGDMDLSLWQFWQVFFDLDNPIFDKYQPGILPHIDVNHLWYLRALWPFTLILAVIHPLLNSTLVTKSISKCGHLLGRYTILLLPILLLFVLDQSIFEQLEGDRKRQAIGFTFFIIGYLLASQDTLWQSMKTIRRLTLALSIVSYITLIYGYQTYYVSDPSAITNNIKLLFSLIYSANQWLWLVTLFGYAYTYLNRENKVISYLNPAVYPFYILHQTVIISLGYPLIQLKLGAIVEPTLILLATIITCAACYEIICRISVLRPFFGINITPSNMPYLSRLFFKPVVYRTAGTLMVIPIATPIFLWFFGFYS